MGSIQAEKACHGYSVDAKVQKSMEIVGKLENTLFGFQKK